MTTINHIGLILITLLVRKITIGIIKIGIQAITKDISMIILNSYSLITITSNAASALGFIHMSIAESTTCCVTKSVSNHNSMKLNYVEPANFCSSIVTTIRVYLLNARCKQLNPTVIIHTILPSTIEILKKI